jgi:hypothetical protein
MHAGSQGWEKSFAVNLFRASAEMSSVFFNMFSVSRPRKATKSIANLSVNGAYDQETFRCFLASESKRSERSGHFCQILLVHWTDTQGKIMQMDSGVAKAIIAAASRSLRESDYIGWYRDGQIVGAVLTVLEQEPMAQVSSHLQLRLLECLRAEFGIEEFSRLQIRACKPHEVGLAEGVKGVTG